ncbi:unnamed protein product [Brassica rapa subsp. narinosa]
MVRLVFRPYTQVRRTICTHAHTRTLLRRSRSVGCAPAEGSSQSASLRLTGLLTR